MIQSIFREHIQTPFDRVGDLVVDVQKHTGQIKQGFSDVYRNFKQAPGRVYDFFVDDYHPMMGAAFRAATLPLLLPTPLGALAAGQAVLAIAHLGTIAYDVYLYEDEIEEFFIDVKRRHERRGSLGF